MDANGMVKLNLGCGGHIAEGWTNVDIHRSCECESCMASGPDLIADVRELPYEDGEVDVIYCGHLLEHLPIEDVVPTLREWRRVLREDGKLCIVGPDYNRAETIAMAGGTDMRGAIWPGIDAKYPGEGHAWCATGTNSLELIRQVFPDAVEVPIAEVDPFWPAVAFLPWQFAVAA